MALHSSPHMLQLYIFYSFLSLFASCSENLVVATGKGLIKAVALSETFLSQEPAQRKHIVGAIPAGHYRCSWLANEGNVALSGSIESLAYRKSQNCPQCCAFFLIGPTGVFSVFVAIPRAPLLPAWMHGADQSKPSGCGQKEKGGSRSTAASDR